MKEGQKQLGFRSLLMECAAGSTHPHPQTHPPQEGLTGDSWVGGQLAGTWLAIPGSSAFEYYIIASEWAWRLTAGHPWLVACCWVLTMPASAPPGCCSVGVAAQPSSVSSPDRTLSPLRWLCCL
jgi:hypothetical protein